MPNYRVFESQPNQMGNLVILPLCFVIGKVCARAYPREKLPGIVHSYSKVVRSPTSSEPL